METPSSTRRVTRSQTLATVANNSSNALKKVEESEKGLTKSRQRTGKQQQDRSALIDITNDSPIVGLAMGSFETPSSEMSRKRVSNRATQQSTPGSGEALLRGQVKTLLQKVEEEAELSKLSMERRPFPYVKGLVNSPMGLLAPTPANTPKILGLCSESDPVSQSPVEDKFLISQMVSEMREEKKHEGTEFDNNLMITRSLLLDFSEKSEGSYSDECSSVVTLQGDNSEGKEKATTEDDDASIWSIQVNASTKDDQEEDDEEGIEEVEEECDNDYYYEEEEEEGSDAGLVNELCEAINKISVNGIGEKAMAKFSGKHTKFVYNSDDELEGVEEVVCSNGNSASTEAPTALHLNGWPTPKGKHLFFPEELDETN